MTNLLNLPSSLGKSFILSGFVPAFLFVLLNALYVAPSGVGVLSSLLVISDNTVLDKLGIKSVDLTMIVIPALIAVLLAAFNTFIIRMYEGAHGFERGFLLKSLLQRRQREHDEIYRDLQECLDQLAKSNDPLEQRGFRMQINQIHDRLFNGLDAPGLQLPFDKRRVLPTRFGNLWGVIEEYPALRYGMDGATFWPRMISVLSKDYSDMIADHKMTMDTLLNSPLLAILFGVEMIVVAVRSPSVLNVLLAAGAFVAAYMLYQAAVSSLREMGELIKSCYDLFRGALLDKLGIKPGPLTIEAERKIWSGLTSYILAGDSFYYPALPPQDKLPVSH